MSPSKHTQPPIWDADPAGPPDGNPEAWRTSVIELSRRIFLQPAAGGVAAHSAFGVTRTSDQPVPGTTLLPEHPRKLPSLRR